MKKERNTSNRETYHLSDIRPFQHEVEYGRYVRQVCSYISCLVCDIRSADVENHPTISAPLLGGNERSGLGINDTSVNNNPMASLHHNMKRLDNKQLFNDRSSARYFSADHYTTVTAN